MYFCSVELGCNKGSGDCTTDILGGSECYQECNEPGLEQKNRMCFTAFAGTEFCIYPQCLGNGLSLTIIKRPDSQPWCEITACNHCTICNPTEAASYTVSWDCSNVCNTRDCNQQCSQGSSSSTNPFNGAGFMFVNYNDGTFTCKDNVFIGFKSGETTSVEFTCDFDATDFSKCTCEVGGCDSCAITEDSSFYFDCCNFDAQGDCNGQDAE